MIIPQPTNRIAAPVTAATPSVAEASTAAADALIAVHTTARALDAQRRSQHEPQMSRDAHTLPTQREGLAFRDEADKRAHELLLARNLDYKHTFSMYERTTLTYADLDRSIAAARSAIIEAEARFRAAYVNRDEKAMVKANADVREASSAEQLSGAYSRQLRTKVGMYEQELRRVRDPLARSIAIELDTSHGHGA